MNWDDFPNRERSDAEEQLWSENIRKLVILVFALNVLSAVLFISLVNRPVYDEPYNIFDVHNYASRGLCIATLLSQRNPPGPTGFLWMAAGVHLLGGQELRSARIATLMSWILLTAGILIGARYSRFPQLWYGALLATLVFPHALEAMATLLTEGPSLFFAVMGSLVWAESVSRSNLTPLSRLALILAGLAMGLAISCRQYDLALLPAATLFCVHQWGHVTIESRPRWLGSVLLSLACAVIPVLLIALVWKGISSPGMTSGTSYDHMWKATVGLNLLRPIIVAFYTGVYLIPLTFPAMFHLNASRRKAALMIAVLGAAGVVYFEPLFLQPGPLNSLIRFASRLPFGGTALLAAIAIIIILNFVAVCSLLWEQRRAIFSCAPAIFAFLVFVFFIVEQIGVGGNLPFYDRYTLQLAPFIGVIAFAVLPRLSASRLLALSGLFVLSHVMLWRFAFWPKP